MAVKTEILSPPAIEQPEFEKPASTSWQELTAKTFTKGSDKLRELSAYMVRRTGEFFAITTRNTFIVIPGIVKTTVVHGVLTGAALAAETAYAPPEHQMQWYTVTTILGGTLWGLSILGKVLPE